MDSYEIKVIAIISAVVIALCVFTLIMELLRMKPGCCWISPPLLQQEQQVDLEKDGDRTDGEVPAGAATTAAPLVITPILKPDSRNTPDQSLGQKRVKSASAVRFYAYNRSNSVQAIPAHRKKRVRAKTAGHVRKSERANGFYGVTFANESFEMVPTNRKVSFSPTPTPRTADEEGDDTELTKTLDDTELEDEIPEDNTSTVSLESKEPTTPAQPSRLQSVSVETETEPIPKNDVNAGTQCEAFLFIVRVTYAEAGTQTDDDPDFEEVTAVLREVKPRASQGTQMRTPTPPPPSPPPPVCVDTACGPSTIDLIDPVPVMPPKQSPPQREFTPPSTATKGSSRAKSRAKSKLPGSDRRKLKSRGMNLHTAQRAVSGRKSSHSAYRPTPSRTHPVLKSAAKGSAKKQINYPKRTIKGKPPREQWQIATERVYMQQRVTLSAKPSKTTDKTIIGLKTALSEVKSFTTPPEAVFEVTRGILLIIGDKEEEMTDWRKICNLLGRRGPKSPVTRLVNLKASSLTEEQRDIGLKILEKLSLDEISKVSHGASVLYKWIAKLIRQEKASTSSRV